MKGILTKGNHNEWYVKYNDEDGLAQFLPLHSDDVQEIYEQSKVFDNIEARISAYPNIDFKIVENQKLSGISRSAKIIKKED